MIIFDQDGNAVEVTHCRLKISQFGYFKGDIAKIVQMNLSTYRVFVPNRASTSPHAPVVNYRFDLVKFCHPDGKLIRTYNQSKFEN